MPLSARCSSGRRTTTLRCGSTARVTTATVAVEQRRLGCDGAQRQPDQAGRRPGPGGRQGVWLPLGDRHPGDRPGGEERAGGRCPLVRAPAGCEQLEHPCARGQSDGGGGDVEQSNSVESDATAANLNGALPGRGPGSGRRRPGSPSRRSVSPRSRSRARSRFRPRCSSERRTTTLRVRVDSGGRSGDVTQSNSVDSDATALNINLTKQDADQDQGGRKDCGCHGTGIQAIGQEAKNEQGAFAGSLAVQAFGSGKCGCPSGGTRTRPWASAATAPAARSRSRTASTLTPTA